MFNEIDENAMGLLASNHQVDVKIDLSDYDEASAIEIVEKSISTHLSTDTTKIWFQFPLAQDGKKTLFQPIGKLLKDKLAKGEIKRLLPSNIGGWIVRLK